MSHFWLTPVTTAPFVVLGDEREKVGGAAWEAFRRRLGAVHPRLVPLFKSQLLAADEGEAAHSGAGIGAVCGGADGFELDIPGPIAFDGSFYTLSHCGEAFFDRLLDPEDALPLAESLVDEALTEPERSWLDAMCRWWRQGRFVVLLS